MARYSRPPLAPQSTTPMADKATQTGVNTGVQTVHRRSAWMQDAITMKTHLLRYFVALAEERHFGRAAQRLSITQPPLSMALKALEQELGVVLMERDAKHVTLTPAGETFLVEARKVLHQIQHATQVVRGVAQGLEGRLNVGITGSMIYRLVPEFCRQFQTSRPQVQLSLHEVSTRDQLLGIASGQLDAGFLNVSHTSDTLETLLIGAEPLVCCMPEHHRLAQQPTVNLQALGREVFVMFAREVAPANYDNVITCLQQAGIHPQTSHAARQWLTVVAMVSTGQGVALVPRCLEKAGMRGVRFVPLQGVQASTPAYLAWRRQHNSPLLHAFIDSVRQQLALPQLPVAMAD